MSEAHGHGGCRDRGDLGPCDCLCHRDEPTTTAAGVAAQGPRDPLLSTDDVDERFKAIWLYCMIDHEVGTLPGGPCQECVKRYAVSGPPDGKWNR